MKRELSGHAGHGARLFVSLSLLLLIPLTVIQAQSGRNKPPSSSKPSSTSTPQGGGSTRQKRANAPEPSQQKPSSQSETKTSAPNKSILNEEPPPFPVKTPNATSQKDAKEGGDEVDSSDVIRINSNLVTVPATVIDRLGKAVADLKIEDFELRVDGQPRPISDLGRNETPVQLVMLFDNSSSLSEARDFEKQAAVRFFKSVMRPMDQAAIYSVSTIPVLEQGFTNNTNALVRTIEHFGKPEGATALFDTIVMAAAYLQPYQGRKVIVIVSDGADTISDLSFDATLQRTLAADCQVYAVQTGQIENANLRDLAAERRLETLTMQTGGAVYVPRGNDDLDNAFAQINADLAQQYVLSYYPSDEPRDGRFHTISLRVQTRQGLRVRARKGYYAATNQRRSAIIIPASSSDAQQSEMRTEAGSNVYQPVSDARNRSSLASNTQASAPDSLGTNSENVETNARSLGPPDPDGVSTRTVNRNDPVPLNRSSNNSYNSSSGKERNRSPDSNDNSSSSKPDKKTAAPSTADSSASKPAPTAPVTGGVLNGRAVSLPKPLYTLAARNAGASGAVNVEILVDENGVVVSARALSGHPMLRPEAVRAAYQARFSPTFLSGKPVKVSGVLTYNFVAVK